MDPNIPAKSSPGQLYWATKHLPADPTTSFAGKTVLITGANVGLGYEAAIKFARLGASTLIFGVRSLDKGAAAKTQVEQISKCKNDVIQLIQLDMSNYSSIESFANKVSTKFPTIDAVILNAGLAPAEYKLGPNNLEEALQVNVISTTYLAILLLPKLRQTSTTIQKPTHLEFVVSLGHADVKANDIRTADGEIIPKVNDKKSFNFITHYSTTKLLEIWAMRQIAARVSVSQVIVVSSCPSLCRSDLGRNFGLALRILDNISKRILGRSPEAGSRTLVSAVLLGPEAHGGFWTNDQIQTPGELVVGDEGKRMSEQFWNETLEILRKRNSKIESILGA